MHSLKYLRSTTLGCRDIWFRKSEFVSKTQFLYQDFENNVDIFKDAEELVKRGNIQARHEYLQ